MKINYATFEKVAKTNFDKYIDTFVDEFIDEIGEDAHDLTMYEIRFFGDEERATACGSLHFLMGAKRSSRLYVEYDGYAEIAEFPIPEELDQYILKIFAHDTA